MIFQNFKAFYRILQISFLSKDSETLRGNTTLELKKNQFILAQTML